MQPPFPMPPMMPTKPPARTFVKMGYYMICSACALDVQWCNCASRPAADKASEEAHAAASLSARIADVKR